MRIVGLKAISGQSKGLPGCYSGHYLEVFCDRNTHRCWSVYQYSPGQNTWTEYDDPNAIKVCNISEPTTMKELRELVEERLAQLDRAA